MTLLSRLLRTKSIEQLQGSADVTGGQLKKALGAWDLTMLGVGAIIGAGILSSLGTGLAGGFDSAYGVTRPAAGPALVVSFILTAVACGFTAFAYAEMASMIPVSGSAYTYAYAALGELAAWVIGWDLLLEYAISNVAVAISWGSYAETLLRGFGIHVPGWLTMDSRSMLQLTEGFTKAHAGALSLGEKVTYLAQAKGGALAGADVFRNWEILKDAPVVLGVPVGMNLLAIVITILVTALCAYGIRESARFNSVMVATKVGLLLLVIAFGAFYVRPENYHPFAPNGLKGIQAGAAIIFFAFIGFDAVSTTAEEARNPGRDLPLGIIGSLGICTVIYVGVCLVISGILPYTAYHGVADPIAHAFAKLGMPMVADVVSIGAVAALAGALLVYQLAQPRIFMSMSRDGLLPRWFSRVGKRGTPLNATWVTGVLVILPAGLMNIDEVVELANIGTLFAFVLVAAGVMILRVQRPDAPRKFRTPAVWVTAPLGIAFCVWLAAGLPATTWKRFVVWLVLGLVSYFFYGAAHSRLGRAAAEGEKA